MIRGVEQNDPPPVSQQETDKQEVASLEELRHEHELVRSAGMISKRLMALVFGLVFMLIAIASVGANQWTLALLLGGIGGLLVAWAVYAWVRRPKG